MGSDIFNLALDALMIAAITGLWVMWFQQAGQRKKVEKMLLAASEELQTATKLLDQVMASIAEQKATQNATQNAMPSPTLEKEISQTSNKDKVSIGYASHAKPLQDTKANPLHKKSSSATSYSAQMMRLNREGLSAEDIADKLDVPIAQVRLMLLLQKPKA